MFVLKINFRPNSQLLTEMSREVKRLLLRSLPSTHDPSTSSSANLQIKSPEEVLLVTSSISCCLSFCLRFSEPLPRAPLGDKDTKPADIPKTLRRHPQASPQLLPSPSRRFYCNLKTLQQFMSIGRQ